MVSMLSMAIPNMKILNLAFLGGGKFEGSGMIVRG